MLRTFFYPPGRERNPGLEGLRAFAVWLVFCVHVAGTFAAESLHLNLDQVRTVELQDGFALFVSWVFRSHYGVQIFFVLSGFLICRLVLDRRGFAYGPYLLRRVLRIYPAFLLSLVVALAASAVLRPGLSVEAKTLLANLVFLNGVPEFGFVGYNAVSWSLFYELAFYLVFPALAYFPARSAAARAGVILVVSLLLGWGPLGFGYVRGAAMPFAAGAILALKPDAALARWAQRVPQWAVLALYLASTTALWGGILGEDAFAAVFPVAATGLALHAGYGEGWLGRAFRLAPVRALGNISYSFYLLHVWAVISVTAFVRGSLPQGLPGFALLGGMSFALALAASALSFRATEYPYFSWARRGTARATAQEPRG